MPGAGLGTRLRAEWKLLEGKAFQAPFAGRLQLIKGSPPISSVWSLGWALRNTDSLGMEWPRSAAGSDGGRGHWHGVGRGWPQLPPHCSDGMVLGTQPGYQGVTRPKSPVTAEASAMC